MLLEKELLSYKCKICGFQGKNSISIANHLQYIHKLTVYDYIQQYLYNEIPECSICHKNKCLIFNKPFQWYSRCKRFNKMYCSNSQCRKQYNIQCQKNTYINNEELREKHRQVRINYLKQRSGKTAWERRAAGDMSYLEQWFYDNVIVKYDLSTKYDIVTELSVYPYFIDFAFTNINLAVELDGRCHFINGETRVEHDIKKNQYLIDKGWKVFRIKYTENTEDTIQEFLNYLKQFEIMPKELIENRVYKYHELKKEKRNWNEYIDQYHQKLKDLNKPLVELMLKSDIDFSKFGWVNQAAVLLNIQYGRVHIWMKKYMPEFYKTCFHRKSVKK